MPAPRRNRFERRRAETRRALVRAARQILAESGGTSASIHAIAECADVGLGFCNRFTGKPDLFDAAVADAPEEYARAVDERLRGVDDPAERLAGGVRLSARTAESYPEIIQILCHSELGPTCAGDGPAPRASATWSRAWPQAGSPCSTR
jgi:AcrR family transcriptional regulator